MLVFKLILEVVIAFGRLVALLSEVVLILINFRLQSLPEVLEGNYDDGDIIETAFGNR